MCHCVCVGMCVVIHMWESRIYKIQKREKIYSIFMSFSLPFWSIFMPGQEDHNNNPLLMSDKAVGKQNIPTQCTRMTSDCMRHFQLMRGEPEGLGARLTSTGSLMRRSGFVDMRYFVPPSRASGNLGIAEYLATLTCWDLDKLLYQLNSAHSFEFRWVPWNVSLSHRNRSHRRAELVSKFCCVYLDSDKLFRMYH